MKRTFGADLVPHGQNDGDTIDTLAADKVMIYAKDVEEVWDDDENPVATHDVGEFDWCPAGFPNL